MSRAQCSHAPIPAQPRPPSLWHFLLRSFAVLMLPRQTTLQLSCQQQQQQWESLCIRICVWACVRACVWECVCICMAHLLLGCILCACFSLPRNVATLPAMQCESFEPQLSLLPSLCLCYSSWPSRHVFAICLGRAGATVRMCNIFVCCSDAIKQICFITVDAAVAVDVAVDATLALHMLCECSRCMCVCVWPSARRTSDEQEAFTMRHSQPSQLSQAAQSLLLPLLPVADVVGWKCKLCCIICHNALLCCACAVSVYVCARRCEEKCLLAIILHCCVVKFSPYACWQSAVEQLEMCANNYR